MAAMAHARSAFSHDRPVHQRSAAVRQPLEARGTSMAGNQARLRRLTAAPPGPQAKLTVGAVDDPLEHEADAAADQVMRMADPVLALTHAPPTLSRKCAACEKDEEHSLQREADGAAPFGGRAAPSIVHDVLKTPGHALDPATHTFMSDRFGVDFSDVRVHTDARAAHSAAAVNAHAYTVGRDVVFGAGRYDPAGEAGRRLIAHELAHTLQQGGGAPSAVRRAPCRSAAQCATPASGDPGQFGVNIAPQQAANAAANAAAPAGSPAAVQNARHGLPATNIRTVMTNNGVALRPEVFGFFINPDIGGTAGAQTNKCQFFPPPGPAGAPPDKFCVQVPVELEDRAATVVAVVPPENQAQREDRLLIVSTAVHEMEHARFNDNQLATVTPTADCSANTVVRTNPDPSVDDFRVGFFLGEVAAIAAQFPTYFDNHIAHPDAANHQLLFTEERNEVFNPGEGILGVIKTLQCKCSCDSVKDLITQTVNLAMTDWTDPQKLAFLRAMSRMMPSFWPPALRRADHP